MRLGSTLISSATFLGVFARPATRNNAAHESVTELPDGWRSIGEADGSLPLMLSVALKQPRMSELEAHLQKLSDPSHSKYGAYLSQGEISNFQKPDQEGLGAVRSWLNENGVSFTVEASHLIDADFGRYQYNGESPVLRATHYSLPSEVADYVDFVYPVTQFMRKPSKKASPSSESQPEKRQDSSSQTCPGGDTTPDCIKSIYNINYQIPDADSPVTFGIAGFLEEYPNQPLLHTFLENFSPYRNTTGYNPLYNFTMASIQNGSTNDEGNGAEAQLDIQYSMPFIQPMNVTYFSTGGRGPYLDENGTEVPLATSPDEPWIEFLEALLERNQLPTVLSISYTDDEEWIPRAYAKRACNLFMQLGARGTSVLVASGDGGSAGTGFSECKNHKFRPTFPVDCPYVTSVGATAAYSPLSAEWFSAGGFSEYFDRPAWQDADANKYLAQLNGSHDGWYAPGGRGIPDLSAIGTRFVMGEGGFKQKGTSARCGLGNQRWDS
ncbi:tripeptidyl peptidase precursor [Stemphylium lycopersici]|nr:tripeptidyl peptidase precursor [Stemphylium lycopersici]